MPNSGDLVEIERRERKLFHLKRELKAAGLAVTVAQNKFDAMYEETLRLKREIAELQQRPTP